MTVVSFFWGGLKVFFMVIQVFEARGINVRQKVLNR